MTRFMTAALATSILAASAIAIPAAAQPADQTVSIRVSYADLDIGHSAGAKVLLHRLQAAAVQACGGMPDVRVLAQVAAFDRCRREAVGRAVAQIDSPTLDAAANRRGRDADFASR